MDHDPQIIWYTLFDHVKLLFTLFTRSIGYQSEYIRFSINPFIKKYYVFPMMTWLTTSTFYKFCLRVNCVALLRLEPVITLEANCYYIWGQLLLHLEPVKTFQANCYCIWNQLLHLRPIITFVASTVRPSGRQSVRPSVNQPCAYLYFLQWDWELAQIPGGEQNAFISFVIWIRKFKLFLANW